jgi:hypothetical protein
MPKFAISSGHSMLIAGFATRLISRNWWKSESEVPLGMSPSLRAEGLGEFDGFEWSGFSRLTSKSRCYRSVT